MILVDFRGYDTFGEITVLGIAAVGVLALLDGFRTRRPDRDPQGRPWSYGVEPMLLRRVARLVLPIALVLSVYIYWRGHNLPGGGFIAGLVTAVALVLQYMALGQVRAESLLHGAAGRRFMRWIGIGLGIAWLTGVGAFFFGRPFLTSAHGHPTVPVLGELPLATAALFDLGVYITVVGATMLMLSVLGAASKETAEGESHMSMEFLFATGIGWVVAVGIYLLLRGRSFAVVLGLTLIGYAVNVFIFTMGRLWSAAPPILGAQRAAGRPAAAGAGADGHRHRLRHHRLRHRAGAAQPARRRQRPRRRPARCAGRRRAANRDELAQPPADPAGAAAVGHGHLAAADGRPWRRRRGGTATASCCGHARMALGSVLLGLVDLRRGWCTTPPAASCAPTWSANGRHPTASPSSSTASAR